MDELTKELHLLEALTAHSAMTDARMDLEDTWADGQIGAERWEAIRHYVFPLLEAESERLHGEIDLLRSEG